MRQPKLWLLIALLAASCHRGTFLGLQADAALPGEDASQPQSDASTPIPLLTISDAPTFDFGIQTIGTSTAHVFTLSNSGEGAASGMGPGVLAAPFAFQGGSYPGTGGTCTSSLTAASNCTLVVTFAPSLVGGATGRLAIGFDGGAVTVGLAGIGVNRARITIKPGTPFDFGPHCTGSTIDQAFVLANDGSLEAVGLQVAVMGPFQWKGGSYPGTGGDCGLSLAKGASCRAIVSFVPTTVGTSTGSLSVTCAVQACDREATVDLRGEVGDSRCSELETYSGSGWFWSNPRPQGNPLSSLWGSAEDDVWFVGQKGVVLHWDGSRWTRSDAGTSTFLHGVWGSGTGDVWVSGNNGAIIHWDGTAWTSIPSGSTDPLEKIWGSSPNDVYVASLRGVLHWDGGAFATIPAPAGSAPLHEIWGSGPQDVWAIGLAHEGAHWDGTSWAAVPISAPAGSRSECYADNGLGVWGSGSDDVWEVIYFGPDTSWDPFPPCGPGSAIEMYQILHWDGIAWTVSWSGDAIAAPSVSSATSAIWGSGPSDVWVGDGAGGNLLHWNGVAWSTIPSDIADSVVGIWGSGEQDVWAVGDGGAIIRWNGNAWSELSSGTPQVPSFAGGIWGAAPDDMWVVGTYAWMESSGPRGWILHWDGTAWTSVQLPGDLPLMGQASVWGSGPSDVWTVGQPGATGGTNCAHWDGSTWSPVAGLQMQYPFSIWGSGPNDIWVAGEHDDIDENTAPFAHWDGKAWSSVVLPMTGDVYSIWGTGPSDVWAAGCDSDVSTLVCTSALIHWDGSSWSRTSGWTNPADGASSSFVSLWGSAPDDVWAIRSHWTDSTVGASLLHWNGTVWSSAFENATGLSGIWGLASDDVWAVGGDYNSGLLHWNGSVWASVPYGTAAQLRRVWGSQSVGLWIVGDQGTILDRH